ncbi:MAG: carboxypeptidase-like regulatory domain-containing protein [Acidobacteria bacterium]|nr:carboxypeptidase-like regulatory domain-containing protein [Acidobacteriota bacterium]
MPAFSQEPPPTPPPQNAPPPQTQPPVQDQELPAPADKPEDPEATPAESEAAAPKAPAPKGATLHGRVTTSDRKTPIPGAQVHAIAKDGNVYSSPPADGKGRYRLTGIAPGSYRLAISTDEGVFSLESEVGISSANDYTVELATIPAEAARGVVPGLNLGPRGFAVIVQGKKQGGGGSFWGSAKGITLLVVSAAAVALILTQGDNSEEESPVSPSLP